jgi:acylphosphatase
MVCYRHDLASGFLRRQCAGRRQIAKGFDVIGWVRNLPDGRVELQVGGDESEVFAFLDSIMESELRSHIDKQTRSALAEPVKARGFDIHHE